MKPNPWIYPAIALVGVGCWIGYQKNSASTIEREISTLTERIRQTHAHDTTDQKSQAAEKKIQDKKIDWLELSTKIGQMQNGGMPDMKSLSQIERLILEMTTEELIAQIDEIESLDLPEASRLQLEQMLILKLVEKDPQFVLQRFAGKIGKDDSFIQWALFSALAQWAGKDPHASAAWFDQQIAAGTFDSKSLDGKSRSRINFERFMVGALMKSDLQAATARVLALPADQRDEVFEGYTLESLSTDQDANYAALVRSSLSSKNATAALASTAGNRSEGNNFDRIDQFITAANANDNEKNAIVSQVMNNQVGRQDGVVIDRESLEKARTWAATQAPNNVNRATGHALAEALWFNRNFSETSAIVLEYQQSSGSDDILVSFLESPATRQRANQEARALIPQIKDPVLRKKIQNLANYKSK